METPSSLPTLSPRAEARQRSQDELNEVVDTLKNIRAQRAGTASRSTDNPPTHWPRLRRGLVFCGLSCVASLANGWLRQLGRPAPGWLMPVNAISALTGLSLMLSASGAFDRRSWRTVANPVQSGAVKTGFGTLRVKSDADYAAVAQLERFSRHALLLALDRLRQEEADLRDLVAVVFGAVPAAFVLGIPAAILSAVQSTGGRLNLLTVMILVALIVGVGFSIYGVGIRLTLFDLRRMRALVGLELSLRAADAAPGGEGSFASLRMPAEVEAARG
jgi:hypothetical protein